MEKLTRHTSMVMYEHLSLNTIHWQIHTFSLRCSGNQGIARGDDSEYVSLFAVIEVESFFSPLKQCLMKDKYYHLFHTSKSQL